jgi:hypothetical protein
MREYEQTRTIDASADETFAWLSDVSNLPRYLPPVIDASIKGPSSGDNPGQRVRATLEYPGVGGGTFDAEGYLAVDENRRRMEWGAEVERDYSGWLEVAEGAGSESQVTVHLNFGERSVEPELRERTPEGRDPLAEGVSATLESIRIRRQIEEGSGKVEAPSPPEGAAPHPETNPTMIGHEGDRLSRASGVGGSP